MEHNMTEKRKGTDREDLVVILFGILLAWLIYQIVLKELPRTLSDYNGHTYVYLPMFNHSTWFQGWKTVPYCLWHMCVLGLNHILRIPLEVSAACDRYVSLICLFCPLLDDPQIYGAVL